MSLNIRPFRALRAKNHLVKKVVMPAFDNLNAEDISKIIKDSDRPLIIFPQGTRVLPDERPPFKKGASRIYEELKISCQPVAINSGYVWPKKGYKNRNQNSIINNM